VVTRILGSTLGLVGLLAGCGGGGDAEAKQAALGPAAGIDEEPSAAAPVAPAPAPTDSSPMADAEAPDADDESLGRESFSYSGGSRDPFVSLLANARVGPELPDLTLVAIYYDTRSPSNSVVVMREKLNGKRHSLKLGDRLGRIRVSNVRPKDVTFTIDDFGTERQETLTLRRQEDAQ
jgi:hypothetical protein